MIKLGSKLKILKTANKATALLPNGKISKVASMEDKSEYSDDFIYFIARALTANVPNANGDYFPDDELEKSYESFIGKNLHLNHDADDVAKAVGKIIDAWFVRTDGDIYVVCLCKIDKKLHPELARNIETGIIDSVSMGCSCQECECSICGCKAHNESEMCDHLKNFLGREINVNGKAEKVSSINRGITFNELSLVGDPADSNAHMYQIYANKRGNDMKKKAMQDGKTEDVVQEEVKQEIEKTVKDKEETETKAEEKTVKEEVKEVKEEIKETVEQLNQAKEVIDEKKEELKELKEEVKDIKEEKKEEKVEEVVEEKKEETIEKEESCGKKAETAEEIKDIEEIKEKAKEAIEEDKAKENGETTETETKEEVVEEKKEEDKPAETVEEVKEKVEDIKEEVMAEIGDIFSPVKDETKEFKITDIFEDNGEKFVETEIEGKKKVYALKNVKLRKKAEEGETEEEIKAELQRISDVIATSYADSKALLPTESDIVYLQDHQEEIKKFFPEDVDLWQWANIPEEEWNNKDAYAKTKAMKKQAEAPAKPTTAPSAGMKWVFNQASNTWEQKPENTKTVEVQAGKEKEYELYHGKDAVEEGKLEGVFNGEQVLDKAQSIWDDINNDFPGESNLGKRPSNENEAVEFLISKGFYKIKRKATAEYKYTLIRAGKQPRWLVIDKATNKIAQKLFLKDLPKEAERFDYKKVIASAIKEVGLNKVASKLGVSKTAIKADDKYTLIQENGESATVTVKSISINDVTKETFINVQIGDSEGDNIFSSSKFVKMIEDGQLQKAENVKEEVVEEKVVEETAAENGVETTEDTAPMNQDETSEPMNDLQSSKAKAIGKKASADIVNNAKKLLAKAKKLSHSNDRMSYTFYGERISQSDLDSIIIYAEFVVENGRFPTWEYSEPVGSEKRILQKAGVYEERVGMFASNKNKFVMKKKAETGDGELVPQSDPTPDFKLAPEVKPNEANTLANGDIAEPGDVKKDIIKNDLSPMDEIANLMNILQIKLSEVDDKESKLDFVRREIQDAIDYVDGKPIEEIEKGEEEELDVPEIAEFTDIKWEESDNAELPAVASVDVDDINWNNINAKRDGAMILAHIYKAKPLSYKVAFKKVNKMDKVASKTNKVSFVGILKEQIKLAKEEVETMKITAQIKEKKELCEGIVKKAMAKGLVHIDSEEIRKNILQGMSQMEAREMAVKKAADEQVKNLMAMDKAQITAYKETVANFQVPVFKEKKQSIGRITASADYDETVVLPWSRKR